MNFSHCSLLIRLDGTLKMDKSEFYKARLSKIEIKYQTIQHQPVVTMENSHLFKGITIVKNMIIKNKKLGTYILIMSKSNTKVDFKEIAKTLHTSRSSLRFATEAELAEDLNVVSGFVSPLIVMPNQDPSIFLIDRKLVSCSRLGFHVGRNDETVIISYGDLKKFSRYMNIALEELAL